LLIRPPPGFGGFDDARRIPADFLKAVLRRRRDVMMNVMKRQVQWVLGLWMVALALAGCGTATGAAVGAGTGAAVGYGTGYGAGKGALIGTGVGAAAGALYDIYQYNKK
jgi:hypothetical protein